MVSTFYGITTTLMVKKKDLYSQEDEGLVQVFIHVRSVRRCKLYIWTLHLPLGGMFNNLNKRMMDGGEPNYDMSNCML